MPPASLLRKGDPQPATIVLMWLPLLLALTLAGPAAATEMIIAANPSVDEVSISRNNARLLYTLRRTKWTDGQPVHVYVLSDDHPLHTKFVKNTLGLYPRQLRRVWDRRTYSGTGQAPEQVDSIEEMRARIAARPGAIGYLPADLAHGDVRALEVKNK